MYCVVDGFQIDITVLIECKIEKLKPSWPPSHTVCDPCPCSISLLRSRPLKTPVPGLTYPPTRPCRLLSYQLTQLAFPRDQRHPPAAMLAACRLLQMSPEPSPVLISPSIRALTSNEPAT